MHVYRWVWVALTTPVVLLGVAVALLTSPAAVLVVLGVVALVALSIQRHFSSVPHRAAVRAGAVAVVGGVGILGLVGLLGQPRSAWHCCWAAAVRLSCSGACVSAVPRRHRSRGRRPSTPRRPERRPTPRDPAPCRRSWRT